MNRKMKPTRYYKKSIIYAIAFLLLFMLEAFIALYVHDRFIRPYAGDILVVILLYCAARCFMPEGVFWLPVYVFLFAVFVEFLQYFRLVERLSLQDCRPIAVLLGSTFDWLDIFCYFIGCLILLLLSWLMKIKKKSIHP